MKRIFGIYAIILLCCYTPTNGMYKRIQSVCAPIARTASSGMFRPTHLLKKVLWPPCAKQAREEKEAKKIAILRNNVERFLQEAPHLSEQARAEATDNLIATTIAYQNTITAREVAYNQSDDHLVLNSCIDSLLEPTSESGTLQLVQHVAAIAPDVTLVALALNERGAKASVYGIEHALVTLDLMGRAMQTTYTSPSDRLALYYSANNLLSIQSIKKFIDTAGSTETAPVTPARAMQKRIVHLKQHLHRMGKTIETPWSDIKKTHKAHVRNLHYADAFDGITHILSTPISKS
jgi:hypothetical protein